MSPITITIIEAVLRVEPDYPQLARGNRPKSEVLCTVRVEIDAQGKASDLQVDGCSLPFAEACGEALMGWQWRAYQEGKPNIWLPTVGPAHTVLRFRFPPREK